MLNLRDKDLINGRTFLDRQSIILYLFLAPWLLIFIGTYVFYNNRVTGVSLEKIPVWGGALLVCSLLIVCIYIYLGFTRKLKSIPGKPFREKIIMYYTINKEFHIQMNLLAAVSTIFYMGLNSLPLAVFNCFIVVIMSLEKPAEERFFRHLRLNKKDIKGFKDRPLFDE